MTKNNDSSGEPGSHTPDANIRRHVNQRREQLAHTPAEKSSPAEIVSGDGASGYALAAASSGSQRLAQDNVVFVNFHHQSGKPPTPAGEKQGNVAGTEQETEAVTVCPAPVALDPAVDADEVFQSIDSLVQDILYSDAELGRLSRGLDYARDGNVCDLTWSRGSIHLQVKGSQREPFRVDFEIPYRSPNDTAWLTEKLSVPGVIGQVLDGSCSRSLVTAALADDPDEIGRFCDCPDRVVPCKHIVACGHVLGRVFARDPATLFALRGIEIRELEKLVGNQPSTVASESYDGTSFWHGDELPPLPEIDEATKRHTPPLEGITRALRAASTSTHQAQVAREELEEIYGRILGTFIPSEDSGPIMRPRQVSEISFDDNEGEKHE